MPDMLCVQRVKTFNGPQTSSISFSNIVLMQSSPESMKMMRLRRKSGARTEGKTHYSRHAADRLSIRLLVKSWWSRQRDAPTGANEASNWIVYCTSDVLSAKSTEDGRER